MSLFEALSQTAKDLPDFLLPQLRAPQSLPELLLLPQMKAPRQRLQAHVQGCLLAEKVGLGAGHLMVGVGMGREMGMGKGDSRMAAAAAAESRVRDIGGMDNMEGEMDRGNPAEGRRSQEEAGDGSDAVGQWRGRAKQDILEGKETNSGKDPGPEVEAVVEVVVELVETALLPLRRYLQAQPKEGSPPVVGHDLQ